MFSFLKQYRFPVVFLLLVSISLILLLSGKTEQGPAGVLLEVAGPFQKALTETTHVFGDTWQRLSNLVGLQDENRLLREIIQELKQERIQLLEQRAENRRLRALLGFKEDFEAPLLPAEIVGEDISGWFQTILIDRGTRDGIQEGMAVLCVQGIVGQIMETSPHFARVLLLTDPNSTVAALVQRTRARGIVQGNGENKCLLKYLHRSEDLQKGDMLLSAGVDGVYPKGNLIGSVVSVRKRETELFQEVTVRPSVVFHKLEEVVVLLKKPQAEDLNGQ